MKQKRKLRYIQALAILFLVIGSIGYFAPYLFAPFHSYTELPNSEPHGIAIDKEGNIYCGSKGYTGRIQKYSPDGKFIRGFDTHGGTWRGTDFGFYFNGEGNLCILFSGLSRSKRDSFYRLTIYDSKGNALKTEEYTKPGTDYFNPVKNQVVDSAGNTYIFKGFLFPRVIKQTPEGGASIIISTPIWLWFFQAPFPAFAFFFVSILILVYLSDGAAYLEATLKDLSDSKKRRKIIMAALVILLFIFAAVVLIFVCRKTYPAIIIFAFISFGVMFVLVGLVSLVYALKRTWYYRKHYPEFSDKRAICSIRERLEFAKAIRETTANDPLLRKMEAKMSKFVKICFVVWFVILIIAAITIIRIGPILK